MPITRPPAVSAPRLALALSALVIVAPDAVRPQSAAPLEAPIFDEAAAASGLEFTHFNGMSGRLYLPEIVGSGAALLDYDHDGDLDLYLVQGGRMLGPGVTVEEAVFPPPRPLPLGDRLFRNDLVTDNSGARLARFVDVTERARVDATGYGMGVAAGDYDGDGWTDLYLTNLGANQMLRNRGDGTFEDTTEMTGTGDPGWGVPASFFDYDGDGWLDLYLGNYVLFDTALEPDCTSRAGVPDYCGPLAFRPAPDRLFRNRGDGTFEDATERAGLGGVAASTLGAVAADFDGDGRIDLYVANDGVENNLWVNQGDGTFRDDALLAGAAVSWEGQPQASMGVDAGDFDGDGDEDLFMTHLDGETNTLYLNDGGGFFVDQTPLSGLDRPSWSFTGFGTAWFDFDGDGRLDLLTTNGAVKRIESLVLAGDPYPIHQTNQLFHNAGGGRFEEVTELGGPAFALSEVSRGAAFGDLDNDGDTDVVVTNNAGSPRLLLNRGRPRRWAGARVLATPGPRDALGARAVFGARGGTTIWRRVRTDGSYASANEPRVLAGLGASDGLEWLRVEAAGGAREWRRPPADRYLILAPIGGPIRR